MESTKLIDEICIILNGSDVSVETTSCIIKLLIAEKFRNLDDMNNKYAKALYEIKIILENDKIDDFDSVDKILAIFDNLDNEVEYRHDF